MVFEAFHDTAYRRIFSLNSNNIFLLKGEVDHDGIPYITVVTDGAWAKRSYKNRYNSLSSVAAIVGLETKRFYMLGSIINIVLSAIR